MYRVSIQSLQQDLPLEEDAEVDLGEEDVTEFQPSHQQQNIQSHQIVKETEDMIEINLSQEEDDFSKKDTQYKQNFKSNFKRAAINSNDQLVAATSAMANGAPVIYILQVIYICII